MRNLLIVHESQTVRELLERYILSELNDTFVHESSTAQDAMKKLQTKKDDVVICGLKIPGMDGPSLLKKTRDFFPWNRETPFVMLTTMKSGDNLEELSRQGMEHFLISPFTPAEFRTKIDTVCNPVKLRAHDRLNIPVTKAILRWERHNAEAKVVNISANGLLCDVLYSEQYVDLLKAARISIMFPPEYSNIPVKDLLCKVLRVNVLTHQENHSPKQARIAWQFVEINEQNKKVLDQVIEKAKDDFSQLAKG